MNREDWLAECIAALRPMFADRSSPVPAKVRASCSWPSKGALAKKNRRIGEAWSSQNSGDGSFEVFISPVLSDPVAVSATLLHELVHCSVGLAEGHKGRFRAVAVAMGLEGGMTATKPGEALTETLKGIAETIGPYPHAVLTESNAPKKQGTRMIKVECGSCGCVARMTRKWLDEIGPPTCGCGGDMVETE
jgi:hypothetical protein